MEGAELIDVSRETLWVLLKIAGPMLIVALLVGVVISLFQALTQMQEATISFVPKIIAVFLVLLLSLPFIGSTMNKFYQDLMSRIVNID